MRMTPLSKDPLQPKKRQKRTSDCPSAIERTEDHLPQQLTSKTPSSPITFVAGFDAHIDIGQSPVA
jgi:hypothetical protein